MVTIQLDLQDKPWTTWTVGTVTPPWSTLQPDSCCRIKLRVPRPGPGNSLKKKKKFFQDRVLLYPYHHRWSRCIPLVCGSIPRALDGPPWRCCQQQRPVAGASSPNSFSIPPSPSLPSPWAGRWPRSRQCRGTTRRPSGKWWGRSTLRARTTPRWWRPRTPASPTA